VPDKCSYMLNNLDKKIELLRRRFRDIESAVIAFSGGIDSGVLVEVAHQELGDRMVAATALSPSHPSSDRELIINYSNDRSIPQRFIESKEFHDPIFLSNPDDRCYHCKKYLYTGMIELANELNFKYVIEGTNLSDLGGHRPGYRASKEQERVKTPLIECEFTKDDVRALGRHLDLPMAEKPAAACLASRIPTGEGITPEILQRIDSAEDILRAMSIGQVRVRHHKDLARIEVDASEMILCMEKRDEIYAKLIDLGWKYVTLDIVGYRTGGGR
jgi:pyridinium-3,5-biscarboxylic acid mononucleotide sulfurtransferase